MLSERHQRFVEEYVSGCSGAEAYRRAGYEPSDNDSAANSASRLLGNVGIKQAIAEAREKRKQDALVSEEEVVQGLLTEAKRVGDDTSHSARVSAWSWLGKYRAMFIDRQRQEGTVQLEVVEEITDAADEAPNGDQAAS